MTDFILSIIKRNKNKDAKELILKEFFNYSSQKKIINKAARESAADQRDMLEKYEKSLRSKSECAYVK